MLGGAVALRLSWFDKANFKYPLLQPGLLIAGQFPWVEGSDNFAVSSSHRHYAQRYRHLSALHTRSVEEKAILRVEVIRMFNWLEEREAAIQQRLAALQAGEAGASSGATGSWAQLLVSGETTILQAELARIQGIYSSGLRLLAKHRPPAPGQ